ncbi:MAG: IS200/IS605 family transposase [Acidobacteria bacterium]|nr:IS200/IS605 family transposase [Acidobacteriota bacterium]MCA1608688.1 IS200/IS605 family transposase [Acidobacteriota bacterium]
MPQSLVKILTHIVFSTKNRANLIKPEIENELYAYIHGIIENNGAKLIIANGTENHSHLLVSLGRNEVGDLIGDIKRNSSSWIKKKGVRDFYWQRGYGAFSIGQSQVPEVSRYIRDQKEHHRGQAYEDEFRALCRKYDVGIEERYCWD